MDRINSEIGKHEAGPRMGREEQHSGGQHLLHCGPSMCRSPCIFQSLPVQLSLCLAVVVKVQRGVPGSRNFHPRKQAGWGKGVPRPCRAGLLQVCLFLGEMLASEREAGSRCQAGLSD